MKVLLISVFIVIGSLIRKSWLQQSQTNPSLFEFFYNYTFYKYGDTQQFNREYDFVIVGAGSGGCVLANRLSENSKWSVLLLEAGAGEENFLTDIPIFAPFLQQFSTFNWAYRTEPNKGFCLGSVDGRCNWPRGRGLGGTSLINFMIYSRGNRYDYDRWFQLGNKGWSYSDVLPYFKKSEMIQRYGRKLDFSFHGHNGSLNVEIPDYRTPLVKTFLKSARFFKYKSNDPNGKSQTGFSVVQATTKNGRRHSAAKAYLLPIRNRPNLFISKNSFVTRILIDPLTKIATGVNFYKNRKQRTVRVRKEVILTAGSINSPQLLMLSGIGPKSLLKRLQIPLMSDLNVGSNLQDHISVPGLVFLVNESVTYNDISIQSFRNYFDYFIHNRGPLTIPGGAEALAFINTKVTSTPATASSVPNDYPNIEIVSGCGSLNGDFLGSLRSLIGLRNDIFWETYGPILGRNAFSLVPVLLRPKSLGSIQLAANDPFSAPLIYPNFFHDPDDIRVLIEAIKWTINLTKSEPYRRFNTTLYTKPLMGCEQHKFGSDSYWECHIRTIAISLFHQSGTCKMGPRWDKNAVVDDRLRVYGIGNLRVADASIMPTIVSGHPNAAVFMIGEKAADFIKQTYHQ